MAGNRKHGFRRGNANGRNGNHPQKWFCDGCQREHGYKVTAWGTLEGKKLCARQYDKYATNKACTRQGAAVAPSSNNLGFAPCG